MKKAIKIIMLLLLITVFSANQPILLAKQNKSTNIEQIGVKVSQSNNDHNTKANKPNINEITTPVLIKGFLMGGLNKGKWMKYDEFINKKIVKLDGFKYDVFVKDKKAGTAVGTAPINPKSGEALKKDKYVYEYDLIELYNASKKVDYDIALKADWNLFPRAYKKQSTSQKYYDTLVKDILKNQGLKNPVTTIKQIIRVDLDGDGTEEVLISANNVKEHFEQVKKGDNAVVIFRKLVNGKVKDQVVDKYIVEKDSEDFSLFRILFGIETIADLDGDGIMEVVIKNWYYEGEEWAVYKLVNNQLKLITANGWGA